MILNKITLPCIMAENEGISFAKTGTGCLVGGTVLTGVGAGASFFFPPLASQLPNLAMTGCTIGAVAGNLLPSADDVIAAGYQRALSSHEALGNLSPPQTPAPQKPGAEAGRLVP